MQSIISQRAEAEAFYQAGDYESALPAYQKLIKRMPDLAESWLRLGNCHSRLGDYPKAISAYKSALIKNPSYVKAWYNLSYVQAQVLASSVVEMYQRVPKDDPEAQNIQRLVEGVLAPFGEDLSKAFPKKTEAIKQPLLLNVPGSKSDQAVLNNGAPALSATEPLRVVATNDSEEGGSGIAVDKAVMPKATGSLLPALDAALKDAPLRVIDAANIAAEEPGSNSSNDAVNTNEM